MYIIEGILRFYRLVLEVNHCEVLFIISVQIVLQKY